MVRIDVGGEFWLTAKVAIAGTIINVVTSGIVAIEGAVIVAVAVGTVIFNAGCKYV